ncbi:MULTISPECIES: hypothetical protein [Paracoccus]|uniref:Uncharacterized protein n=1 Tax=Paracoccus versutus TaxID=34007 RepID=A0A3D9XKU5_PARVE|nr:MULTISPECIES: hypothetical protein [Paracoccus]REF68762.1 hypothetical protein BDD41_3834 [Paracoccus versutus]
MTHRPSGMVWRFPIQPRSIRAIRFAMALAEALKRLAFAGQLRRAASAE